MRYPKIFLLSLLVLVSAQLGWAQEKPSKKEQRKIERAERKRLQAEALLQQQAVILELVQEQNFVLEATTLAGRYNQVPVNPSTNFVKVEGNQILIQTADNFRAGYNGLGGITLLGSIRDYQITEGKNGVTAFIQFTDPVMGFSTLQLNVLGNGQARASIVGNWGSRATFQGQFMSLEEARIFRGRPII